MCTDTAKAVNPLDRDSGMDQPVVPASPVPKSATTSAIDANALAYALARNECGEKLTVRDILSLLGLDPAQPGLKSLIKSEVFRARLASYVRELKETGESFKLKARVQAEELLGVQWEVINDKSTPANVRMQGIKDLVEWADLKPKKEGAVIAPAAITINIDLGGDRPEVIDVTPQPVLIEAQP